MDIKGQAALVTGGASGLGAATARALALAGAKVAVLDINADAARKLAAEIGGAGFGCDVADGDGAEAALKLARKAHGPARILVNCAGIAPARRMVGRDGAMPLADFERIVRVNLVGTFNMMRLAAAAMVPLPPLDDGERGVIISTASIAAEDGQIGQTAYAASKGGVAALTLPAARELAQFGVRVMAIAPGVFRTPLLETLAPGAIDAVTAQALFPKRLGNPDDYAKLALHIVGNTFLNGETIRLDGALRLPPR